VLLAAARAAGTRARTSLEAGEAALARAAAQGLSMASLAAAACIGDTVGADELQKATGMEAAQAEELLRMATSAGLMRLAWVQGRTRHAFVSRRLRTLAAERASAPQRRHWHSRMGRASELYWSGVCARHLQAAGDFPAAARAYRAAAADWNRIGAIVETREALEQAVALFEACGRAASTEAVETMCSLGDTLVRSGDAAPAVDTYRAAAARAGRLESDSDVYLSRALTSLADVLRRSGQAEEAIRVLSGHLDGRGTEGSALSAEGRARLQLALALAYREASRANEALEALDRARSALRSLADRDPGPGLRRLEAECQEALAEVYGVREDWERALSARLESMQAWKDAGENGRVLEAYLALAELSEKVRGDFARAARYYEKGLEVADGLVPRPAPQRSRLLRGLARSFLRQGQWESARPMLDSALEEARTGGRREDVAEVLVELGEVACTQGLSEAEPTLREAIALCDASADAGLAARARTALGRHLLAQGDPSRARDAVGPALEADPRSSAACWVAGQAALRLGLTEEARSLLSSISPQEEGMRMHLEGLLAATDGDEAAAARLEQAAGAFSARGDAWGAASAMLDLAVLELSREGLPVLPGIVPNLDRPCRLDGQAVRGGVSRLEQAARQFASVGAAGQRQKAQMLLRAIIQNSSIRS